MLILLVLLLLSREKRKKEEKPDMCQDALPLGHFLCP